MTSSVELRDNRVENNLRFGINVFARAAVLASGNRVLETGAVPLAIHGLGPLSAATVTGNLLGLGGAEGLVVDAVDTTRVRDNVVFSNRDAGILLRATPGGVVANNLVYAYGGPGISVGLGDPRPTTDVQLTNNTIFANGGWGIAIGSGDAPSTGTVVRHNVLQHNVAGGVAAAPGAMTGLSIGFNLNPDGYGDGVLPDVTNLADDPELVAPAGADGVLGDEGFADDDFHLQATSPAIDAGSATAAELGITGAAVAGRATDDGIVDLGYHYGATDSARMVR
jgi:parallel beta-helix repeat protein